VRGGVRCVGRRVMLTGGVGGGLGVGGSLGACVGVG
jgi:hypothetical protein